MKPLPWSHTALDDFVNCPRAYHAKRVIKIVKEEETEAMRWGTWAHRQFEIRQAHQQLLPEELAGHEPYMQSLERTPGKAYTERKVALNKQLQPCSFFDKAVWCRGILDFTKVFNDRALVVDYKTGKPHSKTKQLKLFALNIFYEYPEVQTVDTKYYWTMTYNTTGETYTREQIPELWSAFTGDLKQYVQAFKEDIWQPRPSGLCNGWCPVKDCEFWKPKKGS